MKLLLYLAILIGLWIIPLRGADVGKLIPVEVIAVSEKGGIYTVKTDTGDMGQGGTLPEALEALKDHASGIIYLDTAEFLLTEEGVAPETLRHYLKEGIRVCAAPEEMPLEGIADYLSVHKPGVKLKNVEEVGRLPSLTIENGRYLLREK